MAPPDSIAYIDLTTPEPENVDFHLFPGLPIELRLKVWEHAFPAQVVNLIYDQYNDRFHSYNSTIPTLLHIHHESREMGLKIYQLCFGTESFEPRIYFSFTRDILLFDDYLQFSSLTPPTQTPNLYKDPVPYPEYSIADEENGQIQRVAINANSFWDKSQQSLGADQDRPRWALQKVARPIAVKFPAIRELSIIIESVNPFPKAPIRLFCLGSEQCQQMCDMCYTYGLFEESVANLRTAFGQKLKINFLGAYRGGSRFDLGCYRRVVNFDFDDEISLPPEQEYMPDIWENIWGDDDRQRPFSTDSNDGEAEARLGKYQARDLYEQYEYDDVECSFSDNEGMQYYADEISEDELDDIRRDESLYRDLVGAVPNRAYADVQHEWVNPEYLVFREKIEAEKRNAERKAAMETKWDIELETEKEADTAAEC